MLVYSHLLVYIGCAFILFCSLNIIGTHGQTPCSLLNCQLNTTFCIEQPSGDVSCEACHASCIGCDGPADINCFECKIGYVKSTGDFQPCRVCPPGKYGVNCEKTCNCLNPSQCNRTSGECIDFVCKRGYENRPKCDKPCSEGFFGLECKQECHCPDGETCNHVNGDCSSGRCHPDWTGPACANKLPKLAQGPRVTKAECKWVELAWNAFDEDNDIGSGPIGRYIIFKKLNGTDVWEEVYKYDSPFPQSELLTYNITSDLLPDAYYEFRVDVAIEIDNKISTLVSPGFLSDLVFIPCTMQSFCLLEFDFEFSCNLLVDQGTSSSIKHKTTTISTTTERIFSRDLFLEVKAEARNQTFVKLSWTTVSEFSNYEYNVMLSRQFLGHGDCEDKLGTISDYGPYKITDNPIGFARLKPWGRYRFTVSAVGVVVDVTDSKEVITTTAPTAPSGKITNVTTIRLTDKDAEIVWQPLSCDQRGGPVKFYEIFLLNMNQTDSTELSYADTDTRIYFARLSPYTTYSVKIRFVNVIESGPISDIFYFRTEEEAPSAVNITSTMATYSTITINFQPLTEVAGILTTYTVQSSLTSDFVVSQSNTIPADVGVTSITIERLKEDTKYYLRMAASTQTKTGFFGNVATVTTLKLPTPAPPEQITLKLDSKNSSCLNLSWKPPEGRSADITKVEIEITEETADTSVDPVKVLVPGNETMTFSQCFLEPNQLYSVTIKAFAKNVVISSTSSKFSTGHGIPSVPLNPLFIRSSHTNITVALEPVALSYVVITAYQVKVQSRGQENNINGSIYVTAELQPQDITKRIEFVVGDGINYNGYKNVELNQNTYYMIFFVSMSTVNNITNSASSQLKDAVRTVLFDPAVTPPLAFFLADRTVNCLQFSWNVPQELQDTVKEFNLQVKDTSPTPKGTRTFTLSGLARSYRVCELSAFTVYAVTLSVDGVMSATTDTFYTEQDTPRTPPAPTFVNSSYTTITLSLEPLNINPNLETTYLLTVEQVTASSGRRKRATGTPPGYITAQLDASNIPQVKEFVVGDGKNYSNNLNKPLTREKLYIIHYIVRTKLDNLTKQSYSSLSPPVRTVPYVTATQQPILDDESDDNSALIGIIIALVILIIIIIILLIVYLWWRRRNRFNPYELQDNENIPMPQFVDNYDPSKYWSSTTNLKESRHIIVGRDLVYTGNHNSAMNGHAAENPDTLKISFIQEFQNLPHKTKKATDNLARQNSHLNRFPHLLPYDHSLVQLKPDSMSRGTYINASFIPGYKKTPAYIAAQSPYDEETVLDFWRLIYQKNIKTIVMITNIVEDNVVKCTQYWPNHTKASYGNFLLNQISQNDFADYVIRTIGVKIVGTEDVKVVTLFEFTAWPDHGVPDDPIPFLEMRYKVRGYHGDEKTPILVHCGTGMARTGVFIAVDALIDQFAREGRVMVFDYVRRIRKDRPYMVRTQKQYIFIYEAIFEEFHAGDTLVDLDLKGRYHSWTQKNPKTGNSYLKDQFSLLQQYTRGLTQADYKTALLEDNVKKNRYLDVLPPEKYRPLLMSLGGLNPTDYINAFFVDGYTKKDQFIITQTPLHTTIIDFWKLVYDYDIRTIVMMENFKKEDDSCAEYWPNVNLKQFEPFFIETKATYQEANITIRNFKISSTTNPKEPAKFVRQFQFNVWEEPNSTPHSKTMLLDLIEYVFDWQEESCSNDRPVLVHCKDGSSHSGLFTSVAIICERMEEDGEVDVYRTIKHIKRRRMQCVDDYDQFRFCYKSAWDFMNLRMPGGTFTDTLGQNKTDKVYGVASLSLTNSVNENEV